MSYQSGDTGPVDRAELREEAEELAADDADRAEMVQVLRDMEELAGQR